MIDLHARARVAEDQRMKKLEEAFKRAVSGNKPVKDDSTQIELTKYTLQRLDMQTKLLMFMLHEQRATAKKMEAIEKNTRKGTKIA